MHTQVNQSFSAAADTPVTLAFPGGPDITIDEARARKIGWFHCVCWITPWSGYIHCRSPDCELLQAGITTHPHRFNVFAAGMNGFRERATSENIVDGLPRLESMGGPISLSEMLLWFLSAVAHGRALGPQVQPWLHCYPKVLHLSSADRLNKNIVYGKGFECRFGLAGRIVSPR